MRRGAAFAAGCAAAAAALIAVDSNHFHNGFHFDDAHAVVNNVFIRDLHNLPRIFSSAECFSSLPSNRSYRPLVTATLAIDYALGRGLNPFHFQLSDFLFFFLQCAVLVLLLRSWLGQGTRWFALFGAALFGLHAANGETVNYVIARSETLSTLGVTTALLLHRTSPRCRRLHLYLLPALLGLLAKEQAAMFAPLLFLQIGLLDRGLSLRELLRPRAFWTVLREALPAFAACGLGAAFVISRAPGWQPGGDSRFDYLLTQPFVMLHYVLTFLVPAHLSADADWTALSDPLDDRVLIGVAFVAALLWLSARCSRFRETRPVAFGILWFFVALLPTSSVVPFAEVMNDHRLYFPMIGLVAAACCALTLLRLPRPALAAAAVLVLAAHGTFAHQRNRVWKDEDSLWRDVAEKSPRNARGLMNYGLARMAKGDRGTARALFQRALVLAPQYPYLYLNLAELEGAEGNAQEAERNFRRALELAPNLPVASVHFARWLTGAGRATEAVPLLRRALSLAPADLEARHLLLAALAQLHRADERAAAAREILRLDASDAAALSALGVDGSR